MAAEINWHRYGTKLRNCRPMYIIFTPFLEVFCGRTRHIVQFSVVNLHYFDISAESSINCVCLCTGCWNHCCSTYIVAWLMTMWTSAMPLCSPSDSLPFICRCAASCLTVLSADDNDWVTLLFHYKVTCHMGSHSVTCHPAEPTFLPLPQPKLVLD